MLRQESVRAHVERTSVSLTTIQKRRKRETTTDGPMGSKGPSFAELPHPVTGEEAVQRRDRHRHARLGLGLITSS